MKEILHIELIGTKEQILKVKSELKNVISNNCHTFDIIDPNLSNTTEDADIHITGNIDPNTYNDETLSDYINKKKGL